MYNALSGDEPLTVHGGAQVNFFALIILHTLV